jgi:hypothetical protein
MIASTRAAIAAHLAAWPGLTGIPVLDVMPDDVNEVPCVVVGRPSLAPSRDQLVDQIETTCVVVGRRLNDSGAQPELDGLADTVLLAAFAKIDGLMSWAATEVRADPQTTVVAGMEHPVYLVTLTTVEPRPCPD